MKKKALSLALALAMCLGLTAPAFAAEPVTYENENVIITNVIDQGDLDTDYSHLTHVGAITRSCTCVAPVAITPGAKFGNDIAWFIAIYPEVLPEDGDVSDLDWDTYDGYTGKSLTLTEAGEYSVGYASESTEDTCNFTIKVQAESETTPDGPTTDSSAAVPSDLVVDGWAKERVNLAAETGLVPDGLGSDYRVNITRAQFAAVAVKLYEAMSEKKAPEVYKNPFSDTEDPVVLQAAELGFVSGIGDGKFGPDSLVTREQMAVMLAKVYTEIGGKIPNVTVTAFADDKYISSWAKSAVDFMNGQKILSGKGDRKFVPSGEGGNAKIEEALLVSLKMFEVLK